MKLKTSVIVLLLVIHKVIHAAEPDNPCPRELDHIVADMCTDDSTIEENSDGYKAVDSVLLRIMKQQNNCICHVSLHITATNYTMYMSKYEGFSHSAPVQTNCGLAVDIDYVDISNTTRSIQPIECTSGTSIRSFEMNDRELKFKSRIIDGVFTRGYCMQISRDKAILSCKMNDLLHTHGTDDWVLYLLLASFVDCKRYCLQTETCVAVSYEQNYCFVYNQTTASFLKDNSIYSHKHCVDSQKLQIKCYTPELTTKTSQATTTEDNTLSETETVTPQITKNDKTTMKREKEITKDNGNASLPVIIVAVVGWCFTVLFATTTFCLYRRNNRPRTNIDMELNANNQYEELSASRLSSNYNSLNFSPVTT